MTVALVVLAAAAVVGLAGVVVGIAAVRRDVRAVQRDVAVLATRSTELPAATIEALGDELAARVGDRTARPIAAWARSPENEGAPPRAIVPRIKVAGLAAGASEAARRLRRGA